MKRVLLINMPFAGVDFPSIALGLLKARLVSQGIPCDVRYLNILFAEMVGWENYAFIGQYHGFFAGEQMFSSSLFGACVPDDNRYYADMIAPVSRDLPDTLARMKTCVAPFLQSCLNSIDWSAYDLIGFTSLFEQNLPSLALAYRVKQLFPNKIVVFGGANCEDVMGVALHRCFPFLDYVVSGEADDTFPELVKRLSYGHPVEDLPGIVYRGRNGATVSTGDAPKVGDLDALPFPDFDDFYSQLNRSPRLSAIAAWIVMETSRGCWWGQKCKCTFCGLNGKSIQFRYKSAARVIAEAQYLLSRYGNYKVNYIRTVDNVIAQEHFDDLIPRLAELQLGTPFFFEVRPTLRKSQVKALAAAGVKDIQPGLENLNSHVLKLMRKGVTSLQNIQLLKWARQYDINASWNLIYGFPGEVDQDYANCLELANLLTHLNAPIGFGRFRMDRFSYNLEHAAQLGLVNVRPQAGYRYVYPFDDATLSDLCYYFDYDYSRPIDDGGWLYPLHTQVNVWKGRRDQLCSQRVDGRLMIRDTRPVALSPQVVLHGARALIYEYCDRSRTAPQVRDWLADRHGMALAADEVRAILEEFVNQRLMVKDNTSYLSLAVMTYTAAFEEDAAQAEQPVLSLCGCAMPQ